MSSTHSSAAPFVAVRAAPLLLMATLAAVSAGPLDAGCTQEMSRLLKPRGMQEGMGGSLGQWMREGSVHDPLQAWHGHVKHPGRGQQAYRQKFIAPRLELHKTQMNLSPSYSLSQAHAKLVATLESSGEVWLVWTK